jgi:serine phosphatase RsbU (regulator of sigma subunit)
MFLGLLLPGANRVRFLSAGHDPILCFQSATDEIRELEAQGCPLGIDPTLKYDAPVPVAGEPSPIGLFFKVFA